MKPLFLAILSLVIFGAIDAKAQTQSKIYWSFTYVHDDGKDYWGECLSDNLDQDIAARLPLSLIKEGWSCVRKEVGHDGGFVCRNGSVSFSNDVNCARSRTEENTMSLSSGKDQMVFTSVCWK